MIKELQVQVKILNDKLELTRKEITLTRKESIEDNNQTITRYDIHPIICS